MAAPKRKKGLSDEELKELARLVEEESGEDPPWDVPDDGPPVGEGVGDLIVESLNERADAKVAQDFAILFDSVQGQRVIRHLEELALEPLPLNGSIPLYYYLFMDGRRSFLAYIKHKVKEGQAGMAPLSASVN